MTTEVRPAGSPETDSLTSRMQEFVDMANFQAANVLPQNNDPYTASFETALVDYLKSRPLFYDIYQGVLADSPKLLPEDLIRQNVKTFQFIEKERNPSTFPLNRATPDAWTEPFELLMHDEEYLETFYVHIFRDLASNISERGITLKIEALLHEKVLPKILDHGSSLNWVLNRLDQEGDPDLAYNSIDVMRRVPRQRGDPYIDPIATNTLNKWLQERTVRLGPSLGIDIVDYPRDSQARARAISDSHYMGELVLEGDSVMENLSQQSDVLAHTSSSRVGFIADIDAADYDATIYAGEFDISFASTMLYQSEPEERRKILSNAEIATADDGIVVVQDFIRKSTRSGSMQVYKRWPKYTYGVWVKDMQHPELGYQKHFSVYSGRVEKIIPQAALGRLPLAHILGLVDPR